MSTNPSLERILERFEPGRRDMLRKILIGTAVYAAPVVASFSMDSLGGTAHAQSRNQSVVAVPATSDWSLAGLAAFVGAAGAMILRRRRGR